MPAPSIHLLRAVLGAAAAGWFPPADGATTVLPPDADGTRAVVAFTGHAFVLADVEPRSVAGGGFGGALAPSVLAMLAGTDCDVGSTDVVLAAWPTWSSAMWPELPPGDPRLEHPRVLRARAHRREVRVFGDDHGVVVVGRGLVGRLELAVERFDPAAASGRGRGRRLIDAGLAAVADGEPCWAQVAAGNARSLRTFLAAGFVPVGAEVLITPRTDAFIGADTASAEDGRQ